MRAPKITEENLRNQIDVVKEEIRLNVLNRPYGGFPWILLPPVLYRTFPNAHNGYGDFTELEQADLNDCAQFFDTYYAPANAVLTVGGDIDIERTRELIDKHFGDVPARPAPQRPSFAEPPPAGELRGEHPDPHAPLPALALGYRMPDPVNELDGYLANLVLAAVLAEGDGSRLQQRLVHREPLVTDINAACGLFGPFEARDPDTFIVTAVHSPDVSADRVLAAVDDELDKLAAAPPNEQELAKVKARWVAGLHQENDRLIARILALRLARAALRRPGPRARAAGPDLRGDAGRRRRRGQGVAARRARGADRDPGRRRPVTTFRTAAEIARTELGPRPLPPLAEQRAATGLSSEDTVLDNGLRVVAVHAPTVPMVELRLRIPFAGSDPLHAARAEVLAATILTGTAQARPRRHRHGPGAGRWRARRGRRPRAAVVQRQRARERFRHAARRAGRRADRRGVRRRRGRPGARAARGADRDGAFAAERDRARGAAEAPVRRPPVHPRDARGGRRRDGRRRRGAPAARRRRAAARLDPGPGRRRRAGGRGGADRGGPVGVVGRAVGLRAAGPAGHRGRRRAVRAADRDGAVAAAADRAGDLADRSPLPGAAAREPGVRWLLLLAAGGEHPRGQGIHLPRTVLPGVHAERRHAARGVGHGERGDRAGAAGDALRAGPPRLSCRRRSPRWSPCGSTRSARC